jgi:hypothetical protein
MRISQAENLPDDKENTNSTNTQNQAYMFDYQVDEEEDNEGFCRRKGCGYKYKGSDCVYGYCNDCRHQVYVNCKCFECRNDRQKRVFRANAEIKKISLQEEEEEEYIPPSINNDEYWDQYTKNMREQNIEHHVREKMSHPSKIEPIKSSYNSSENICIVCGKCNSLIEKIGKYANWCLNCKMTAHI